MVRPVSTVNITYEEIENRVAIATIHGIPASIKGGRYCQVEFIWGQSTGTCIPVNAEGRRYAVIKSERVPMKKDPIWAKQGKQKKGGRRRY